MALKEARGVDGKAAQVKQRKELQGKKTPGGGSDNGEALLELFLGEDVRGLSERLKLVVSPLQAVRGKEKLSRTELHKLAKQFVPFLVRILKLCFVNAANVPAGEAQDRGDEVFKAVEIALDGLDSLRSFITGSPFEIEYQRCSFVRRLLAWRRYSAALVQCRKNFSSLCVNFSASVEDSSCNQRRVGGVKGQKCGVATVIEKKQTGQSSVLPHPHDVELTPGLPSLVSGIVTDLIWCTGEGAPTSAENYHELLSLPRQLEPWLITLDAEAAVKQNDTLYKGLYKCVSILVANPAHYGDHLVREFSMLTLKYCAASSSWKQYFKVAYKLSHSLSYCGANNIRLGLDVSQGSMKASHDIIQLKTLWADTEVLELVDCYARLCQTGKYFVEGCAYLCDLVDQVKQSSPSIATILGLYIVGLKFCSDAPDLDAACHDLLRDGAALMENCLEPETEEDRRKYTFSLLKAFEMVKKNLSKYVQGAWGSSITDRKTVTTTVSETVTFNSTLQRALYCWYLLQSRASDFKNLTREEDSILKQGWSLASAPVVSLLRLSLMSSQGVHDCANCIDDLLKRSNLQIDELRWIMASASNMGIQIYNNKNYESACYPFRVAYDAAWARVEMSMKRNLSSPADNQVSDFVSDSCAKCTTLADSLKRSGKNQASFDVLSDGLMRWATIHSVLQPLSVNSPSSLVHIWVRTLHTGDTAIRKSGTQEYICLYSFLKTNCQILHQRTKGVLLEEELLVLHDLGDQGLDNIQALEEQTLQSLLDNVYMVDEFPVERCRVLLEKGRLARLRGVYDFASISEVVSVLTKILEALEKVAGETQIASVENQLAMAYCTQAFCAYESDPDGHEYLHSISSALTIWEVSVRAGRTWIDLDTNGDARIFGQTACCGVSLLHLLLSVNDLLALKGYSLVQFRVQQLIASFSSSARTDLGPKLFSSLWANTRFSHILCPVPYPSGLFASLTQKLGIAVDSLKFWEDCALLCPGTLLDVQLRFMHRDFRNDRHDSSICKTEGFGQAFEAVEKIALSILRTSPKSSGGVFKLAVLFHVLAEYALNEGKLRVACKYAKEALNLRLLLVSRIFRRKYKGGDLTESEIDSAENQAADQSKKIAGRRHILDSIAARAWPKLSAHAKPVDYEPNPWRVLGDYVESLMQMGVISEKMGAVDDALASFSEGYSVSLSQNLPLARAAFKSSLGEVRRKRHQWEAAERDLLLAKAAFENLDSSLVCSCCSLTGRAVVSLRIGDLARRYRLGECPALDGVIHHHDALSFYVAAQESFTAAMNTVNEGCGCVGCKYPGFTEDDKDKIPLPAMLVTVGRKSVTKSQNHKLISINSGPESIVVDLTATFSNMKLIQTEGKNNDTKVVLRRNSRRKPSDDTSPVHSMKLMEKRSTRSVKLKIHDSVKTQHDASSEVAPVVKSVNAGKLVRKRTAVNRSKVENQETIIIDDDPIADAKQDEVSTAELDRQVLCATSTSGRNELSCVLRETSLSSMDKWAAYKWVKRCHQYLARVNLQIGKFRVEAGDLDKAVEIFEYASYLLGIQPALRNPCTDYASYSFTCQSKSFFPLEEAALFYHKSLLQLRKIRSNGSKGIHLEFVLPMNWLVHAYSLSTQAPPLLRKISGLLSVLHVPIACGGFGLLHNLDLSRMRERAAYFHQVSIGAASRQQHLAVLDSKLLSLVSDTEEPAHIPFMHCFSEMQKALAVDPLDLRAEDLSISRLVKGLPSSTLCCVSLVERELASVLKQGGLLDDLISAETSLWVLITRYTDTAGPLSVLLPVNPLVDGEEHLSETSGSSSTCPYNIDEPQDLKLPPTSSNAKVLFNCGRNKFHTSLQDIASAFTSILEESRLSTSGDINIDTVEEKRQWWRWRLALDTRLLQLLKSMENTWLGHWKCLLVAEPDSSSSQESLQICSEELGSWLRSSYGIRNKGEDHWNTYDAIVRMLLQGLGSLTDDQVKEGISTLHKWMQAFLDQIQGSKPMEKIGRNNQSVDSKIGSEGVDEFYKAFVNVVRSQKLKNFGQGAYASAEDCGSRRTRKLRKDISVTPNIESEGSSSEAGSGLRDLVGSARKSITLVLDSELQGLPWESLPVLRGFETYRMPSVGGIRALFIQQQLASADFSGHLPANNCKGQPGSQIGSQIGSVPQIKQLSAGSVAEPSVDPYNTYYVLNPSGDLEKTQQAFEEWFKENLGWEGKVGQIPTIEEYVTGLQKHDLYTYLGHGSGDQYLPERFVRRLDHCAASLLMGCSSGRFSPRGDFEPVGVPLSYLMAGCPAAIANLWDVTDGDIDRFSRFLLHKWLGTPNDDHSVTLEKSGLDSAYACKTGADQRGIKKKCATRKNAITRLDATNSTDVGVKSKMGSFIGEGRDLCRLPYLIGASPVYYGVPTSIIRKEVN